MKTDLIVIDGSEADPAVLAAMHRRCFAYGWSLRTMRDTLSVPGTVVVLATIHGRNAGFLICRQVLDQADVLSTGVLKRYRRKGIGRLMLECYLAMAREARAESLFLEVRESNAGAQALYAKLGFAAAGRRKGYYPTLTQQREDAIVMRCDLAVETRRIG